MHTGPQKKQTRKDNYMIQKFKGKTALITAQAVESAKQ
jgi:hypothetical protein